MDIAWHVRALAGILALGLGLVQAPADAATLAVEQIGDVRFIILSGDFASGDAAQFVQAAGAVGQVVVLLDSRDGALVPALEIGRLIRARGYSTYVAGDGVCLGACSLVWLAGARRYVAGGSRIGFRSGYALAGVQPDELGAGDARVGRYLTELELSVEALVFTTRTNPYSIAWIDPAHPGAHGIGFEHFGKLAAASGTVPAGMERASLRSAPFTFAWSRNAWSVERDGEGCMLVKQAGTAGPAGSRLALVQRPGQGRHALVFLGSRFATFEPGRSYRVEVDFVRDDTMARRWGERAAQGIDIDGLGRGLALNLPGAEIKAELGGNDKIAVFEAGGLLDFVDLSGAREALAVLEVCERATGQPL